MRASVTAATVALLLFPNAAKAADMKLISSVGVRPVIEELVPQFERASGHKVEIMFGTAVQMKAKADAGEPFDLAILNPPQIDDLIKQGKAEAATRADIARSGMGFAISQNATKPDIATDEKLKAYLRSVKTIATGNPAAGGFGSVFFDRLVERLGIAGETRPKTRHEAPGDFAKPVAAGQADLGVGLISEIVSIKGVQSVALMPDDPASFVRFAAAVGSGARQAEAARALLKFLATPAAAEVFKAKGLTPG